MKNDKIIKVLSKKHLRDFGHFAFPYILRNYAVTRLGINEMSDFGAKYKYWFNKTPEFRHAPLCRIF